MQRKKLFGYLLIVRASCVEQMARHVTTCATVSENSHQNKEVQPQLSGELQGKAIISALFYNQSSVLSKAYNEIALGIHINSCTREQSITNKISHIKMKATVTYWHYTMTMI